MTSISLSSVSSQITNNIFSKLDTSNQGTIDATSLSKALSGSADDQASDEVSDLVSSIDTDGDSKISKSELTKGIENLFSQLQSASNQAGGAPGGPPPPGGAGGPPPPRGEDEEDSGLTQDQMQEMASSTDDSKLSELLNNVASNFEAADTNGDGKVTQQEAMEYQQSQNSDSSNPSSTSTQQSNALEQVAKLIKTYGLDQDTSSSYLTTSA